MHPDGQYDAGSDAERREAPLRPRRHDEPDEPHEDDRVAQRHDSHADEVVARGRRRRRHRVALVEEPVAEAPQHLRTGRVTADVGERLGVGEHRRSVSRLDRQHRDPPHRHRRAQQRHPRGDRHRGAPADPTLPCDVDDPQHRGRHDHRERGGVGGADGGDDHGDQRRIAPGAETPTPWWDLVVGISARQGGAHGQGNDPAETSPGKQQQRRP